MTRGFTYKPRLLSLDGVSVAKQGKMILSGVSLEVERGDFVAITGPNGGGKTTLLKVILGLIEPTSGIVTRHLAPGDTIGYLPQKTMVDSHFPVTVEEVAAQGLLGMKLSRGVRESMTREVIERVELTDVSRNPIGEISGGQLQRALLARAMVSKPALLVLDEPLSYLDKHFEMRVYNLLRQIAPSTTIVLVSHEMSVIAPMANVHLIVDRRLRRCPAAHHLVHYDCNSE